MSQPSQQHKRQQIFFCPHLRLRKTIELLFPAKSRPSTPSSESNEAIGSSFSLSPKQALALSAGWSGGGGDTLLRETAKNEDYPSPNERLDKSQDDETSSEETTMILNHSDANIDDEQQVNLVSSSPTSDEGSGESKSGGNTPSLSSGTTTKKSPNRSKRKASTAAEKLKVQTCVQCDPDISSTTAGGGDSKRRVNYWKCLDPECHLTLCGAAGENHAQLHYQDNPTHVLQENITSNRVWCNECNHEAFIDFRGRRLVPALWTNSESEEDPPKGLYNIGNTCFMNAALQNMAAVQPLTSYLLGECSDLSGKYVALSYRWLLSEFYMESPGVKYNKGVMPSRLLHSVRTAHPIFRGFQQHDAQEFLRLFMDTLAEQTLVPHFVLDDAKPAKESDNENESETESFETCDSGNGSEETDVPRKSDDAMDSENSDDFSGRPSKVVMKSIISDIFDGQIESSVQCLSCHQTSRRNEVFQDLSLPIPTKDELLALRNSNNYSRDDIEEPNSSGWLGWFWGWMKSFFWGPAPTLEDCLAAFFSSDELKGKNMYSCEKCGKLRNGVKRCSLYKLPETLCVHLKRFRMYEFNGGMGYSGKISQYVQFPSDGLDVRPFMHKDCPDEVSNYRLMGVICHIGSVMGGHYTAYIRKGDQWFLADDSHVGPIAWETVMDCEAYVLFYQKWNWEDDDNKRDLLKLWTSVDRHTMEEEKFHLISRKWLTKFFWGEEGIPLDNSDVVCPHGHIAPYENVDHGASWIPDSVWDLIMKRYGGGPDLKYSGECGICSLAWLKYRKSKANQKGGSTSRTTSFSDSRLSESHNGSILNYYNQLQSELANKATAANSYKVLSPLNRDSDNASDAASTSHVSDAGSDAENTKLSNGDLTERRRSSRIRVRHREVSQSANATL